MTERPQTLRVHSQADIYLVISAVQQIARQTGLSSGARDSIATAVSELVTNVIKYARSGHVAIRAIPVEGRPGLEVTVSDRGPGIADLDEAMKDNVSTGGTLGLGLPGARRLVDEFDIQSTVGEGTRVRVLKWG